MLRLLEFALAYAFHEVVKAMCSAFSMLVTIDVYSIEQVVAICKDIHEYILACGEKDREELCSLKSYCIRWLQSCSAASARENDFHYQVLESLLAIGVAPPKRSYHPDLLVA